MTAQKGSLFVINVSNAAAFSGRGSIILLELTDEDAAMRVARKIASETGRTVTVRKENMHVVGKISAATTH